VMTAHWQIDFRSYVRRLLRIKRGILILVCAGLSSWYARGEIARRVTCPYVALGIAMASSGLIAAGVFNNLHGTMGLAGWQWLFIIESATGAFFALTGPFFIPDFPGSKTGAGVYWLSEDLRKAAAARSCGRPRVRA
jgi:hypothetical protein